MRVFDGFLQNRKNPESKHQRKFMQVVRTTGVERRFSENEVIVSKTDLSGKITYANDVFLRLANLTEQEALGAPHSLIRHPDMPRAVFKLLWDTLQAEKEIFAYVINMAKNGDHYWVLAHVTPSYDLEGQIVGYHSNRRVPDAKALEAIQPLYAHLKEIESARSDSKEGMDKATQCLVETLGEKGVTYEEFIFAL